jgi:hypothetical protein
MTPVQRYGSARPEDIEQWFSDLQAFCGDVKSGVQVRDNGAIRETSMHWMI